jgi:hypothetical protein
MNSLQRHITGLCLCLLTVNLTTQGQTSNVRYTGSTLSVVDAHDGRLEPAVGVHSQQIMRANREHPDMADGVGWTYNHAPMMAYWNQVFFVEYLSNPVGEHVPPAQTLLVRSDDQGKTWSKPMVLFPPYKVPDGTMKEGLPHVANDLYAVMHQRVGFYLSSTNRLFALGYYGLVLAPKDDPNDGNGIGRVIREIKADGSFGPIYFLRYNHAYNARNTGYPFYRQSKDKGLIKACEEILANPLYMMQMVEESDRNDPLIPLKKNYKAFSYYHLPDGKVVGLWKHALTSISADGGRSWSEPVERAKGFVNSNAKIWGQRTADGRYVTVYNPSEFRWPLALSVSEDGLNYTNLLLVHGEITPLRYGGAYKSYGPQYVRGILEGNGTPPDGQLWLTYSVNKEDIWVASVPVPITNQPAGHADEDFAQLPEGKELTAWNTYSPAWAPVGIGKSSKGENCLVLKDKDPFDYAKAERVIPTSTAFKVSYTLEAAQNDHGRLDMEIQNAQGQPSVRLSLMPDGYIRAKAGARLSGSNRYEPGRRYAFEVLVYTDRRTYEVYLDGEKKHTGIFYAPAHSLNRIVFRTGAPRQHPTSETEADRFTDLENTGAIDPEAVFYLYRLKTEPLASAAQVGLLNADNYAGFVDYFNRMEDENKVQAIPNAQAWDWMKANIPLFDCPQANFQELYYYRWWTFRKHIKETPQGRIMTEFLVDRSYADRYNLIACALGHHLYEGRWLKDQTFLDEYLKVWYRGDNGKPLPKLHGFSSWTPDAWYQRFLVTGDTATLLELMPDLETDYAWWETTHRLPNGLYWQEDVKDGMEESISGGRRKKNARPTINSYMYGNAKALAAMALLAGDSDKAALYNAKADTLKRLVQTKLWHPERLFFQTRTEADTLAQVREAIGYIPWYFGLPDKGYEAAWKELSDPAGFLAPYGLTTAERRHPTFRSRGVGRCEWDGAVWPFATAQTLTAMAVVFNAYGSEYVTDSLYFRLLEQYVESQYHRGRPYIGEYLDEVTGYWLKGDQERSRYYNHSTFNDLIVTGLMGLRPTKGNELIIQPMIPVDQWDWFCLDQVPYRGHLISLLWDKTGQHYGRGRGFQVFVDGLPVAKADKPSRLSIDL